MIKEKNSGMDKEPPMKEQLMRRLADRRYDSVARMEKKKRRRQRQRRIRSVLLFVAACLLCICSFFCGTADGGEGIGDRGRRIWGTV
ncbi:MAG: hypothetical protein V8S96_03160 [Lachnospiraceae bacterium]